MNSVSEWIEITIAVTKEDAEPVANFLMEQGSTGIVEKTGTRGASPGRPENVVDLTAYYASTDELPGILERIRAYLADLAGLKQRSGPFPEITVNSIPDEDWNKKWKSFFQPINVTDHIVIKPSWQKYWKKDGELVIELDPGMAFGTGTHPSTGMCLGAIEELWALLRGSRPLSLLDVGTGSGILAIAAAKLGIQRVVGIDVDYQAVACAKKNARANGVADIVSLSTTALGKITGSFSIVVANILPHVLIDMNAMLTERLADTGFLVLSGILSEKAGDVADAFKDRLMPYSRMQQEEWSCLVLRKGPQ